MFRTLGMCSAVALAAAFGVVGQAQALTMKECSVKYQAAKEADTLKGMKWNDFRKAECADDDASEADAAAAEKAEAPKPSPSSKPATDKPATEKMAAPKTAPKSAGKAGFPSAVSDKYASETPGKARMHTCLDQYRANKEAGAEQPRWIEKGGGYYSQCNTKLKEGA